METLLSFWGLIKRGGPLFNGYVGVLAFRFSSSLVLDLLWYAGRGRRVFLVSLIASLLWLAWLFRPWAKGEEEEAPGCGS